MNASINFLKKRKSLLSDKKNSIQGNQKDLDRIKFQTFVAPHSLSTVVKKKGPNHQLVQDNSQYISKSFHVRPSKVAQKAYQSSASLP